MEGATLAGSKRKASTEDLVEEQGSQEETADEEVNCSICLSEIEPNECSALDSCIHLFHHECILAWVTKENTCPLCRAKVSYVTRTSTGESTEIKPRGHSSSTRRSFLVEESISDIDNATCYICGDSNRDSDLMLCSGRQSRSYCSSGCHYDCYGFASLPEQDWYCLRCSPIEPTDSSGRPVLQSRSPVSERSSLAVPLESASPVRLATRMENALEIDRATGGIDRRSELAPLVIHHLSAWATLLPSQDLFDELLLVSIAGWMWPGERFEPQPRAEQLRHALLLQLDRVVKNLRYTDMKRSGLFRAVASCFRNDQESPRNKTLARRIVAAVQFMVKNQDQSFNRSRLLRAAAKYRAKDTSGFPSSSSSSSTGLNPIRNRLGASKSLPGSMRAVKAQKTGFAAIQEAQESIRRTNLAALPQAQCSSIKKPNQPQPQQNRQAAKPQVDVETLKSKFKKTLYYLLDDSFKKHGKGILPEDDRKKLVKKGHEIFYKQYRAKLLELVSELARQNQDLPGTELIYRLLEIRDVDGMKRFLFTFILKANEPTLSL